MKKRNVILFVSSFLIYLSIYSQNIDIKVIIDSVQKKSLFREKVFVHLNKTTYFDSDIVWFKAYVTEDATNILSDYTSNLQVNLLNNEGGVVDNKIIFIQNGVGTGDFLIDDNYPSGKYYIQARTNYMQNFGAKNTFVQEINIVNSTSKKEPRKGLTVNEYDIQLFPESGYLLEGVDNTIGIKSLINGKGNPFKGTIINSKKKEVAIFNGNLFGMAKATFNCAINETYTAIIDINNTIKKIELPKALKTGVIFSIDNSDSKKIKLTLKTNKKSLDKLNSDQLSILIYRNNYVCEAVNLTMNNNKQLYQELFFDKSNMLQGVNHITLFRNNQPVAERKIFIDKFDEQTAVMIDKINVKKDSLVFKLNTFNSKFKPISSSLSVSIFSKETEVFKETQNIKSALLLSPYVNGHIENPSYYFTNTNAYKTEYLDLLLLNQGWAAYSLTEMLKKTNPKQQFEFESGFSVKGVSKKTPKGYDIALLSKQNKIAAVSKIDDQKGFSFKNIFAYKGESTKVTFIKKKKALIKPTKVSFNKIEDYPKNYSYLITNESDILKTESNSNSKTTPTSDYNKNLKAEELDEVVLKKVTIKRKETIYDKETNIAERHHEIAASFYQNKKVTEEMEFTFRTALDYLMQQGYVKTTTTGGNYIALRKARYSIWDSGDSNLNPDGSTPPTIYIDGVVISGGDSNIIGGQGSSSIQYLKNLSMGDVDEILINKSGAGQGMNGMGGVIKIYLKKGNHKYYEVPSKDLYQQLILTTGYDRAKKYYTPLYDNLSQENLNWIEIDWKNNLQTNENGEVIIKVPRNKFSNDFQFIINGVSKEGLLIHHMNKTNQEEF